MFKTAAFIPLFALLFSLGAQAQMELTHQLGISRTVLSNNEFFNNSASVTYSPKLNLTDFSDNLSLSVSPHLSFSFSFGVSASSFGSSTSTTIGYELPVSADLNFGYGSTSRSEKKVGGFVGAGFGTNYLQSSFEGPFGNEVKASSRTTGLYANAGVRVGLGSNVGLLGSLYTINSTSSNQGNVYGIRFQLIFNKKDVD